MASAKVQCCKCRLPDLGGLIWSVWKATAYGWFRLTNRGFPFWRTFGGCRLQVVADCPGQKWQGLSEWRALIMKSVSTDLQQMFFKKFGEMEKFHLNLRLEMFGFRILIFMCECCFNGIFSCVHSTFTWHIYYVLLLFLNRWIKEICELLFIVIFHIFVSRLFFKRKILRFPQKTQDKIYFYELLILTGLEKILCM